MSNYIERLQETGMWQVYEGGLPRFGGSPVSLVDAVQFANKQIAEGKTPTKIVQQLTGEVIESEELTQLLALGRLKKEVDGSFKIVRGT